MMTKNNAIISNFTPLDWCKPWFNTIIDYFYLYGGRESGKSLQEAFYIVMRMINDHRRPIGEWVYPNDSPVPLDDDGNPAPNLGPKKFRNLPIHQRTNNSIKAYCLRKNKNDTGSSQHAEICKVINSLGITNHFKITKDIITYIPNGSECFFGGTWLASRTGSGKGIEGVRLTWLDEAVYMDRDDLDALLGTVTREYGFQVMFSFNPRYPDDPAYMDMLDAEKRPHDKSVYIDKINHDRNPMINRASRKKILKIKRDRPEFYKHAYEGELLSSAMGLVFPRGTGIGEWQEGNRDDYVEANNITPMFGHDPADKSPAALVKAYVLHDRHEIYVQKVRVIERLPQQYLLAWMFGEDKSRQHRWIYPTDQKYIKMIQNPICDYNDAGKHHIWVDSAGQHEIDRLEDAAIMKGRVHSAYKPGAGEEEGIRFIHKYNLVVNDALIPNTDIGECEYMIYELERFFHKLLTGHTDKYDFTKFESGFDHTIDALRYLLNDLIFPEQTGTAGGVSTARRRRKTQGRSRYNK